MDASDSPVVLLLLLLIRIFFFYYHGLSEYKDEWELFPPITTTT